MPPLADEPAPGPTRCLFVDADTDRSQMLCFARDDGMVETRGVGRIDVRVARNCSVW